MGQVSDSDSNSDDIVPAESVDYQPQGSSSYDSLEEAKQSEASPDQLKPLDDMAVVSNVSNVSQ